MKKIVYALAVLCFVSFTTLPPPPGNEPVTHGSCCLTPHTETRVLRAAAPGFGVNHGTLQSGWQHGEVGIDHVNEDFFVVQFGGGHAVVVLDETD